MTASSMSPTPSSMSRPSSVRHGLGLNLLVIGVGCLNAVFFFPSYLDYLNQNGLNPGGLGLGGLWMGMGLGIILALALIGSAWRGANWARWVLGALAAYGAVTSLFAVGIHFRVGVVYGALTLLVQLVSLVGVGLLFTPASSAWFKTARKPSGQQPAA